MKLSKIMWENYLSEEDLPLPSTDDIHRTEADIGYTLPDDYKDTLLKHQFQVPGEMVIEVENTEEPIGCLYHIFDDTYPSYSLHIKRKHFSEAGFNHLIPFTDNTAGSSFCFDYSYRESPGPRVVFVNNDYEITDKDAITFVANSFTEFFELAEEYS